MNQFMPITTEESSVCVDTWSLPPVTSPTPLLQVADAHTDEVWHVSFSNCGTMLATASKDKTAIIWSLRLGQLPSAAGAARPGSQGLGGGLGQLGRGPGEGEAAAQLLPHQVPARAFEAKGGAGQAGGRGVGDAGQGGAQGGPQQPAALGLGAAAGQLHAQGQVPLVPIHVLQGHKVGLRVWAAMEARKVSRHDAFRLLLLPFPCSNVVP